MFFPNIFAWCVKPTAIECRVDRAKKKVTNEHLSYCEFIVHVEFIHSVEIFMQKFYRTQVAFAVHRLLPYAQGDVFFFFLRSYVG